MMSQADHRVNSVLDGGVITALELADGHDHVEFAYAQADECGSFLAQRGDQRSAERRADDSADGNACAGQRTHGNGGPDRVDQDAGEAVADSLGAERLDLLARGAGLDQSVVDHGGERHPTGEGIGGKTCRVEGPVVKIQVGFLDGGCLHEGMLLACTE